MSARHPLSLGVEHPSPQRHNAPSWLVLTGLFGAPLAWLAQLLASYGLNGDTCTPGAPPPDVASSILLAVIGIIAVPIALFALWAAWRTWRRTRGEAEGDHHKALTAGVGRTRFLGLCGMVASAIFLAAALFELLVPLLQSPCARLLL